MPTATFALEAPSDDVQTQTCTLRLVGDWTLGSKRPPLSSVAAALGKLDSGSIILFDSSALVRWDTALMLFLSRLYDDAASRGIDVRPEGLPEGVVGLIRLSRAVKVNTEAQRKRRKVSLLETVGVKTLHLWGELMNLAEFVGECTRSGWRFFRMRAHYRWSAYWQQVDEAGPQALPIVALLSFLVGTIFAFVSAIELKKFGSTILVANLVGLSMVREMAPIITGVIMCGRTGASYAAAIGTMKVNEEIDALKTLGVSPMEFLVMPRIFALLTTLPMLVIFSCFIGILGGLFVAVSLLGINSQMYINQTLYALTLTQFLAGFVKSFAFAVIVGATGCMRGMQCGNSASAVGEATTSAVVTGITLIIIADAIFAVIYSIMGI